MKTDNSNNNDNNNNNNNGGKVISVFINQVKVSGQLHASRPERILPPVPLGYGDPRARTDSVEKRNILPLPGIEPVLSNP
jgi:hypothetical protein